MEYRRLSAAKYFSQIKNDDDFFIAKGNFLDDFYSASDAKSTLDSLADNTTHKTLFSASLVFDWAARFILPCNPPHCEEDSSYVTRTYCVVWNLGRSDCQCSSRASGGCLAGRGWY